MRYVFIVLCAVFLGTFLYMERKEKFLAAVIFKGLASLCFVALGLLCNPGTRTANLIVCGLVCGAIADVLLNLKTVVKKNGQLTFMAGILVFLAGHILYLAAILPLSSSWPVCIAAGIVLTALLMYLIFKKITAKTVLKMFGVVYIGAITLLNCVAVGNLITDPSPFTAVFAVGALLFLASDIILILNTFGSEFRWSMRYTNICLYYAGQILIALSLLLLAKL